MQTHKRKQMLSARSRRSTSGGGRDTPRLSPGQRAFPGIAIVANLYPWAFCGLRSRHCGDVEQRQTTFNSQPGCCRAIVQLSHDKSSRGLSVASVCKALAFCCSRLFAAFSIVGLPPSDCTIYEMILTQCAVCVTELGLSSGKKCGRCSTRYCGAECQVQHWRGRAR